jgi:hypothetical protein
MKILIALSSDRIISYSFISNYSIAELREGRMLKGGSPPRVISLPMDRGDSSVVDGQK